MTSAGIPTVQNATPATAPDRSIDIFSGAILSNSALVSLKSRCCAIVLCLSKPVSWKIRSVARRVSKVREKHSFEKTSGATSVQNETGKMCVTAIIPLMCLER